MDNFVTRYGEQFGDPLYFVVISNPEKDTVDVSHIGQRLARQYLLANVAFLHQSLMTTAEREIIHECWKEVPR